MRRLALLPLSLLIFALLLTACAGQTVDHRPWTAAPTAVRSPLRRRLHQPPRRSGGVGLTSSWRTA
jgi:hypothetical protein